MWLYIIVAALVILGLVGGAFMGGIFTIILIPLAAVVFVSAAGYRAMAAASERRAGGDESAVNPPYPHSVPDEPGHVPTSPEELTDARRAQQ